MSETTTNPPPPRISETFFWGFVLVVILLMIGLLLLLGLCDRENMDTNLIIAFTILAFLLGSFVAHYLLSCGRRSERRRIVDGYLAMTRENREDYNKVLKEALEISAKIQQGTEDGDEKRLRVEQQYVKQNIGTRIAEALMVALVWLGLLGAVRAVLGILEIETKSLATSFQFALAAIAILVLPALAWIFAGRDRDI